MVQKVSQDYHGMGEFIDLVTECHVLTAAMEHFHMEDTKSPCDRIPQNISHSDINTKKSLLLELSAESVNTSF